MDLLPPSSPPPLSPTLGYESLDPNYSDENDSEEEDQEICKGQWIEWAAGSVWDSYAYSQHDDDSIGWTPIGFKGDNQICLQSKFCRNFLKKDSEHTCKSCGSCYALLNSKSLLQFIHHANQDPIPHTPWRYLSACQLKNLLVLSQKQENTLKLNVCNSAFS